MRRKLTVLLALAVTLTLGLALGRWSPWTAPTPQPTLTASPVPGPAPVTLALLGASTDPWQAELDGALEELCQGRGWAYMSYDCQGDGRTQVAQAALLTRTGEADLAVVCAADPDEAAEWVQTLEEGGCPVVALGETVPGAAWGVSFDQTDLAAAAAEFFQGAKGVLLLPDLAQDPRTEVILTAFPQKGVAVLETGSTWGDVDFGRTWLAAALERQPQADGVVVYSRTGALAAAQTLEGREGIRTLCLTCSAELEEDVAQGRLTAALRPSLPKAVEALEELLPQVVEGKRPQTVTLEFETVK